MRDIEKELFLNSFDIDDYDKKLVNSIEDFEAKIKGEIPIDKEDLKKIIKKTKEVRFVDVSKMRDMSYLFYYSRYEELDLSRWETSKVEKMSNMFERCMSLESLGLSVFDTSKVTDMSSMFLGCESLKELDTSIFNTINVEDMGDMFKECDSLKSLDLSHFNTSSVKNMSNMFTDCRELRELDLSGFDTSKVKRMSGTFKDCHSLEELDISSFNTLNIEDMSSMFSGCKLLEELDTSSFDTSNVKNMSCMFSRCDSLKELDLSHFNTSNVEYMNYMFNACRSLVSLDLSHFDTSSVYRMNSMFENCGNLKELDLFNFDTESIEYTDERIDEYDECMCDIYHMFNDCNSVIFDLKELGIGLELVEKMKIPCFKCDLENKNLEKTHTLDSELLELMFLDNNKDMVFIKHLKEKGELEVYKMNDDFHLVKSNGEGYSINEKQVEKLKEAGILMKVEEPKMKTRRKNKM